MLFLLEISLEIESNYCPFIIFVLQVAVFRDFVNGEILLGVVVFDTRWKVKIERVLLLLYFAAVLYLVTVVDFSSFSCFNVTSACNRARVYIHLQSMRRVNPQNLVWGNSVNSSASMRRKLVKRNHVWSFSMLDLMTSQKDANLW